MSRQQGGQAHAATPTSTTELAVEVQEPSNPLASQQPARLQLSYLSDSPPTATFDFKPRRRSLIRRLMIKLRSGKWRRNSHVVIRRDNEDLTGDRPVVTTFDTGCGGSVNLISTYVLTEVFGLSLDYAEERPIGRNLQDGQYVSVGEVEIRLWTDNWPRYQFVRAFVIESKGFDLFIGRETMNRLFGRLPIIGGFISNPRSYDAGTVVEEQQDADARRAEHNAEIQRRKEQKAKAQSQSQPQTQSQSQSQSQLRQPV